MNNKEASERRRYPRHYAVVADYRIGDSGLIKVSQVKNISAVGICLILYENIAAGTEIELKIYLPDTVSAISARGKVVWIERIKFESELKTRFETGIEFSEIGEFEQKEIAQYVSSVLPKEK